MKVNIEIEGLGAEIVVADLTKSDPNLLKTLKHHQFKLTSLFTDIDLRRKYNIPEWYQLDNMLHAHGPLLNEITDCKIKILCDDLLFSENYPSEIYDSKEEQALLFEEQYLETEGRKLLLGLQHERGIVYSGEFNTAPGAVFNIDCLKLYSCELMIDDTLIALYIDKITYNDAEVQNLANNSKLLRLNFNLFNFT